MLQRFTRIKYKSLIVAGLSSTILGIICITFWYQAVNRYKSDFTNIFVGLVGILLVVFLHGLVSAVFEARTRLMKLEKETDILENKVTQLNTALGVAEVDIRDGEELFASMSSEQKKAVYISNVGQSLFHLLNEKGVFYEFNDETIENEIVKGILTVPFYTKPEVAEHIIRQLRYSAKRM